MEITNPRVASLAPAWAAFRGFTLLFENPANGAREVHGWRQINADPANDFYAAVLTALDELRIGDDVGLCRLPADSLHVTAWDGINDDNVADVSPRYRKQAVDFLDGLLDTLRAPTPFTDFAGRALSDWREPMQLCLAHLENWSDRVLAVQLQPAPGSERVYADFETRRSALNEAFLAEFGTRASPEYRPHITLGYFANAHAAERSRQHLAVWNAAFESRLRGQVLDVARIRLHAFTDLSRFVCL